MTRKSKREIERKVEELEPHPPEDYPTVTLCELLSYEFETVDEEQHLARAKETGEVFFMGNEKMQNQLEDRLLDK